jgi:hypothetical protein
MALLDMQAMNPVRDETAAHRDDDESSGSMLLCDGIDLF